MAKTEPTVITLTLQPGGGSQRQGSLLIQRGDLANLSQFSFSRMSEITEAITQAANTLAALEIEPPDITVKTSASTKKKGKSTEKKKTERKISLDDPPDDEPVEEDETSTTTEPEPEETEVEDDPDDLATLL